jgi:hypothetical protein
MDGVDSQNRVSAAVVMTRLRDILAAVDMVHARNLELRLRRIESSVLSVVKKEGEGIEVPMVDDHLIGMRMMNSIRSRELCG